MNKCNVLSNESERFAFNVNKINGIVVSNQLVHMMNMEVIFYIQFDIFKQFFIFIYLLLFSLTFFHEQNCPCFGQSFTYEKTCSFCSPGFDILLVGEYH